MYPGGGKNAWNLRGEGENAWNPRGFIAPNPRKVRGVHELRGNGAGLMVYYYYQQHIVEVVVSQ